MPEEGECILKTIQPIRKVQWRFVLFIICNIPLVGFLWLFSYWYIEFERWFYYAYCDFVDATHFYVLNYDEAYTIVEKHVGNINHNDMRREECVYFINRFMKYYYSKDLNAFRAITFDFTPRITGVINEKSAIIGYEDETVQHLRDCFGKCVMELPRPSCIVLFVREVLQPFYLFIVYSVILWYIEMYNYYASIILFTSIVSVAINLYQVMDLNKKIYEMAYYTRDMHALRGREVRHMDSSEFVPGDIVFIKQSIKLPFDGVLLGGSVLMNESALTG